MTAHPAAVHRSGNRDNRLPDAIYRIFCWTRMRYYGAKRVFIPLTRYTELKCSGQNLWTL